MSVIGSVESEKQFYGIQYINRLSQLIGNAGTIIPVNTIMEIYNTDPYGKFTPAPVSQYTVGKAAFYRVAFHMNIVADNQVPGQTWEVFLVDQNNTFHMYMVWNSSNIGEYNVFSGAEIIYFNKDDVIQLSVRCSTAGGQISSSTPTQDGTLLEISYVGV